MSSLLLCTLFHRCRNRLREVKQLAQDDLARQGSLGYELGCIYLHPFKATHPQLPFIYLAAISLQAAATSVGIKVAHSVPTAYMISLQSHAVDALTETSQPG